MSFSSQDTVSGGIFLMKEQTVVNHSDFPK